jgi:carbon-monoxide dehydrogenase large subunit
LVSGFNEYAMPRAADLPAFETGHTEVPTPLNPLGARGVGEGATIGATPAVVNAVLDALAPLGVTDVPLPMTPMRVWRAIERARERRDGSAATVVTEGSARARADAGGAVSCNLNTRSENDA